MFTPYSLLLLLCSLVTPALGESKLYPDYHDHPCIRPCEDSTSPMECRYHFVAESYETMSRACYDCDHNPDDCLREHCVPGNGFTRNIKTINRGIPGPTIQVCQDDVIVVELENALAMAEGITIHWHGILQKLTPHMDGVGMITQCPVQAYTSFEYRFVALDPGTHFWHAHTGLQRGEGVFGSLIVRQAPSREPQLGLYDYDLPEHVIVVNEWQNRPLVEVYTGSTHSSVALAADSVLINGRTGEYTYEEIKLPRTSFNVEAGKRYRFRVINSGSLFCPIQISVDNHKLLLIGSDGWPFEPFEVQSFDIYSAERMDFVLEANQGEGSYWLRAEGLGTCDNNDLRALADINYVTPGDQSLAKGTANQKAAELSPDLPPPPQTGVLFNSWPSLAEHRKQVEQGLLGDAQSQLIGRDAVAADDASLQPTPDVQFLLEIYLTVVPNTHIFDPDLYPPGSGPYDSVASPQINHRTHKLGPVPLLSQMDEIPEDQFCDDERHGENCETEFCECIHRLTVKLGQVVEVVLIDPTPGAGFTHPVHLHGYGYRVVAMNRTEEAMTGELFREMDSRGEIARKLSKAPLKDTVVVPNGGYTVIRFQANNPGVWFFHCHLAIHAEMGMAVALQVLDEEGGLPPPPPDFPRCGPFKTQTKEAAAEKEKSGIDDASPMNKARAPNFGAANQKSAGGHVQTAFPQWVLPLVLSMGLVIVGLCITTFTLWRRDKHRKSDAGRWSSFPTYDSNADKSHDEVMNDGRQGTHFSYSKKQERVSLTK